MKSTEFVAVAAAVAATVALLLASRPANAETRTAFEFSRALETCDEANDLSFSGGTTRVVYSFNQEDPSDEPQYHGPNRGTASVNIVGSNPVFHIPETDVVRVPLQLTEVTIPPGTADTVYWCEIIELPADQPYHAVKFEMIINATNTRHIHHAVVTQCEEGAGHVGLAQACPSSGNFFDWPDGTALCEGNSVVWAWAIGGVASTFPTDVGFPIGENGVRTVMLELHYDLPGEVGLTDNSGLAIHVTPSLRPIDAGVLSFGVPVDPPAFFETPSISIPPGEDAFDVLGWCPGSCFNDSIASSSEGKVTLLAAFLHAHLAGRKISVQHVRDGIELAPIVVDRNYDFNYQQYIWFEEPRELLPGDDVLVTCTYDTSDRDEDTVGGFATREEMCLTYFLTYPPLGVNGNCWSIKRDGASGTIEHDCGFGDRVEIPTPQIVTPVEQPDPCPADSYPHPPFGDSVPSTLDADVLDEWKGSFENSVALGQDILDSEEYMLYWTFNRDNGTVRFGVDVATAGWLGFGLSPNGGMVGSDVVVAWLDDATGEVHFSDRFAVQQALPPVDGLQDYFGIRGLQYDTESPSAESPDGTQEPGEDGDDNSGQAPMTHVWETFVNVVIVSVCTTIALAIE